MNWQLLIWNIFVWSFTGVMITINHTTLWWLMLPAAFTITQNASELIKAAKDDDSDFEIDAETRKKMMSLVETAKRGGRI